MKLTYEMNITEFFKLKQIIKDTESEIAKEEKFLRNKKRRLKVLKSILEVEDNKINDRVNEDLKSL